MRIIWVMSTVVLLFMAVVCGWAFAAEQEKNTVSGTSVDMDWAKFMITV